MQFVTLPVQYSSEGRFFKEFFWYQNSTGFGDPMSNIEDKHDL